MSTFTPLLRWPRWAYPRLWIALLSGLLLATGGARAQSLQPIPRLEARVTDLTGTLTAGQQAELEQKLADFEARKGTQIAVLLVPTTSPEEIEQYSIRVVDAWKLGRKSVSDGALLILAKNDHKVRIENGRGLEGVLTDVVSTHIIDDTMVPLLKQGQFYPAIAAGVDQMIRLVDGEPLPPPDATWHQTSGVTSHNFPMIIFGFLIGSTLLRSFFGRTVGAVLTGVGIGVVALLVTQALAIAIGAGVVAFIIALILGLAGNWNTGSGGWGGGLGGGFGGGGFGGGGGGFSGGGGGFAGGGASGSW